MHARHPRLSVALAAAALLVSACGGDGPGAATAGPGTVAEEATSSSDGAAGFPVTVTNCATDIAFAAAPERVLVLGRAGIFRILHDLGVSDRVVARAGAFPAGYYDEDTLAAIEAVPSLSDELDESGHLQISQEALIDTEADLVVGLPDGIDQEGLAAQGIPILRTPSNCPEGLPDPGYDDIHQQVEMYGQIFGRIDEAAAVVADLEDRVAAVEASASDVAAGRTAAVLYPTVGGGTVYAYGTGSMSHQQLATAGFENVFGDTDERVFEVTGEELISRDPDVLILLYSEGEPGPVADAVRDLPGADRITAIRDDAVLPMLFSFGEYPSPLVVEGLETIVEAFSS